MISMEQILSQVKELPTLPESVSRLSNVARDDRSKAADFEKVIRPDLALTTNLLRLVNSAYFGLSREITSVRQAVALMGVKRVFEVAMSGIFFEIIPPYLDGYDMESSRFWRHSIAVGALSESIADRLEFPTPDLIFTAGLLHDIGKIIMNPFLSDHKEKFRSQITSIQLSSLEAERLVFGTDHTEIGAVVAQMWNLPSTVEAAIRWHHQPNEAPPSPNQNLIDLVHLSNGLAHIMGYGSDLAELSRRVEPQVFDRLKVKPDFLEQVLCETYEQINSMAELTKNKKA